MWWTALSVAWAGGAHLEASRVALDGFRTSGGHEQLEVAVRELDAALAEDPTLATWLHAVRVHGARARGGDEEAVAAAVEAAGKAADLGDKEAAAKELQRLTLTLTRASLTASLEGRRGGGAKARADAYRWARHALEVDDQVEGLGFLIPAQRAETLAVAANTALDSENVDEAFEHYAALRAMGHKDVGVARSLANHKAASEGVDAAVRWLHEDVAQESENLDLIALQADLLLDARRPADAVAVVGPHMVVFEQTPEAWVLLGRVHEANGELAQARDALDRCLDLAAGDVGCLWGRGRIPYRAGRALTVVETEGKKRKKSSNYGQRRALYKEALPFLERAHEADPHHIGTNAALLAIYTEFDDKAGIQALQP